MTSSPARGGPTPGSDASGSAGDPAVIERVEDGVHYASHDLDRDGLSTTVALAVAEVAGTSATELVPDISNYVDPDGLDRIFRTRPDGESRGEGHVELVIDDYRVRIDTDGEIAVTPPDER